jgi:hypothetical protein
MIVAKGGSEAHSSRPCLSALGGKWSEIRSLRQLGFREIGSYGRKLRYLTTAEHFPFCETASLGKASLARASRNTCFLLSINVVGGENQGDLDWMFSLSSHVLFPDLRATWSRSISVIDAPLTVSPALTICPLITANRLLGLLDHTRASSFRSGSAGDWRGLFCVRMARDGSCGS